MRPRFDTAITDASGIDAAAPSVAVTPVVHASVQRVESGPLDAGAADGGKGKPPLRPCKPGEMVVYPSGLRKPCGL